MDSGSRKKLLILIIVFVGIFFAIQSGMVTLFAILSYIFTTYFSRFIGFNTGGKLLMYAFIMFAISSFCTNLFIKDEEKKEEKLSAKSKNEYVEDTKKLENADEYAEDPRKLEEINGYAEDPKKLDKKTVKETPKRVKPDRKRIKERTFVDTNAPIKKEGILAIAKHKASRLYLKFKNFVHCHKYIIAFGMFVNGILGYFLLGVPIFQVFKLTSKILVYA